MWEQAQEIANSRDYGKMIHYGKYPEPGEYVITGIQSGNFNGERGWQLYVGYVVQVRKKAGAFGSNMVLIRHPDGVLVSHENQSYHRMEEHWLIKAKALFLDGITPDQEDYSQPYTILGEKYPETGKIIEPRENGPPVDESPMMKITISKEDGSKEIVIV